MDPTERATQCQGYSRFAQLTDEELEGLYDDALPDALARAHNRLKNQIEVLMGDCEGCNSLNISFDPAQNVLSTST